MKRAQTSDLFTQPQPARLFEPLTFILLPSRACCSVPVSLQYADRGASLKNFCRLLPMLIIS